MSWSLDSGNFQGGRLWSAYAAFCAERGLRERLAELLDGVDVEDTAALQAASVAARETVDATPMPEAVQREIRSRYEELVGEDAEGPVAVRSSATAQDTAENRGLLAEVRSYSASVETLMHASVRGHREHRGAEGRLAGRERRPADDSR